mgnify:CR=1 FL=1
MYTYQEKCGTIGCLWSHRYATLETIVTNKELLRVWSKEHEVSNRINAVMSEDGDKDSGIDRETEDGFHSAIFGKMKTKTKARPLNKF